MFLSFRSCRPHGCRRLLDALLPPGADRAQKKSPRLGTTAVGGTSRFTVGSEPVRCTPDAGTVSKAPTSPAGGGALPPPRAPRVASAAQPCRDRRPNDDGIGEEGAGPQRRPHPRSDRRPRPVAGVASSSSGRRMYDHLGRRQDRCRPARTADGSPASGPSPSSRRRRRGPARGGREPPRARRPAIGGSGRFQRPERPVTDRSASSSVAQPGDAVDVDGDRRAVAGDAVNERVEVRVADERCRRRCRPAGGSRGGRRSRSGRPGAGPQSATPRSRGAPQLAGAGRHAERARPRDRVHVARRPDEALRPAQGRRNPGAARDRGQDHAGQDLDDVGDSIGRSRRPPCRAGCAGSAAAAGSRVIPSWRIGAIELAVRADDRVDPRRGAARPRSPGPPAARRRDQTVDGGELVGGVDLLHEATDLEAVAAQDEDDRRAARERTVELILGGDRRAARRRGDAVDERGCVLAGSTAPGTSARRTPWGVVEDGPTARRPSSAASARSALRPAARAARGATARRRLCPPGDGALPPARQLDRGAVAEDRA